MSAEATPAIDNSPFSRGEQISVVSIVKWLDWVTGADPSVFVALPMIQRGSVWTADKVVNLWDSLLRGMPVGCFTVSVFKDGATGKMLRRFGQIGAETYDAPPGSLSLLDGQQRTIAMCIGWPKGQEMDRRVWVDFGRNGPNGQPFSLRVTSKYNPFGYRVDNQAQRLSLDQRRNARHDFDQKTEDRFKQESDYSLPLDQTKPYGSLLPVNLRILIDSWQNDPDQSRWTIRTVEAISALPCADLAEVHPRVLRLGLAFEKLFKMQVALVSVDDALINNVSNNNEENTEPPLVVLFERIANAGVSLSPSDYVFSLIKHRFPEAHNLVQKLHSSRTVAALLSANELVMTAVRVAAATSAPKDGRPFSDNPAPSPKDFNRIVRRHSENGTDFIRVAVLPLLGDPSDSEHKLSLSLAFDYLQKMLRYSKKDQSLDPGLPVWAFPQLERQLVQILVLWILLRIRSAAATGTQNIEEFEKCRPEVIRFTLFWMVCVNGREKEREKAGKLAVEYLVEHDPSHFPGWELAQILCDPENNLALPLQAAADVKDYLCAARLLKNPPEKIFIATLKSTLDRAENAGPVPVAMKLANRWINSWSILLWLQREGIENNKAYENSNPLAGPEREKETPFDYDHITPQNDWAKDGRFGPTALYEFCEGHHKDYLGNNIGNIRIWDSSSNRGDGDYSPVVKFNGRGSYTPTERDQKLRECDITPTETQLWIDCSPETHALRLGEWNTARAEQFKQVVEMRAFRLYERFLDEADFGEGWLVDNSATQPSNSGIAGSHQGAVPLQQDNAPFETHWPDQ